MRRWQTPDPVAACEPLHCRRTCGLTVVAPGLPGRTVDTIYSIATAVAPATTPTPGGLGVLARRAAGRGEFAEDRRSRRCWRCTSLATTTRLSLSGDGRTALIGGPGDNYGSGAAWEGLTDAQANRMLGRMLKFAGHSLSRTLTSDRQTPAPQTAAATFIGQNRLPVSHHYQTKQARIDAALARPRRGNLWQEKSGCNRQH
jgi:hypothetical protein